MTSLEAPPSVAAEPGRFTAGLADLTARVRRLRWPFRPGSLDAAWAAFAVLSLLLLVLFPGWDTIPFHAIWISFTLLYGFRAWAARPTLWVLAVVIATTGAAMGIDV